VDRARGVVSRGRLSPRRLLAAGLAGTALALLLVASALARPTRGADGVSAVQASGGHRLPENPSLHPGERVVVTAEGFARRATIAVGLVGRAVLGSAAADGGGRVSYRFTVPTTIGAGQHALLFSGRAGSVSRLPAPVGTVRVTVPLTRRWPFRTPGAPTGSSGAASEGAHGGHSADGAGAGPSGSGSPALTGADVLRLLLAGVVAVAGGIALLSSGSRRRRRRDPGEPAGPDPIVR
jgi:hypothetical protein